MTRRSASSDDPNPFRVEWEKQRQQGETPEAGGRTAEEARRDKTRKRKIMPSERRRRQRKICLRLSSELVAEFRTICASFRHIRPDGTGAIASRVLELLLDATICRYREGGFRLTEVEVPATVLCLTWRDGMGPGSSTRAVPPRRERTAITPTLSEDLVKDLRRLGKEFGFVDASGNGQVASAVVELFLATAVAMYRQGGMELVEGTVALCENELVENR